VTVINMRGWDELEKKLRSNEFYAGPVRELFKEMADYGTQQLSKRAPKGQTGTLAGSVESKTDVKDSGGPLKYWIKFTSNAENASGYRYGFALNAGRRKTKNGYSEYTRRRTGKPTKAWFTGLRNSLRNRVRSNMRKVGQAIEGNWKGK